jgi:hypothetical protein
LHNRPATADRDMVWMMPGWTLVFPSSCADYHIVMAGQISHHRQTTTRKSSISSHRS